MLRRVLFVLVSVVMLFGVLEATENFPLMNYGCPGSTCIGPGSIDSLEDMGFDVLITYSITASADAYAHNMRPLYKMGDDKLYYFVSTGQHLLFQVDDAGDEYNQQSAIPVGRFPYFEHDTTVFTRNNINTGNTQAVGDTAFYSPEDTEGWVITHSVRHTGSGWPDYVLEIDARGFRGKYLEKNELLPPSFDYEDGTLRFKAVLHYKVDVSSVDTASSDTLFYFEVGRILNTSAFSGDTSDTAIARDASVYIKANDLSGRDLSGYITDTLAFEWDSTAWNGPKIDKRVMFNARLYTFGNGNIWFDEIEVFDERWEDYDSAVAY